MARCWFGLSLTLFFVSVSKTSASASFPRLFATLVSRLLPSSKNIIGAVL